MLGIEDACISGIQENRISNNNTNGDNDEKPNPKQKFGHTTSFCCYAAYKMSKEFQMRFLFLSTTEKKLFTVTTYQRRRDTVCVCVCLNELFQFKRCVCCVLCACVRTFVCAAHCCTPVLQSKSQFCEFFSEQKCVNHTGLNYLEVSQCVASRSASVVLFAQHLRCAVELSMSTSFRV